MAQNAPIFDGVIKNGTIYMCNWYIFTILTVCSTCVIGIYLQY